MTAGIAGNLCNLWMKNLGAVAREMLGNQKRAPAQV